MNGKFGCHALQAEEGVATVSPSSGSTAKAINAGVLCRLRATVKTP
jgi:hypothetical protein